jgi:sugar O-acyltransferase (sialic acid O-acetyltransferase NeuD family)
VNNDNQTLKPVLVYGAGGHAKTVLATLEAQGLYQPVALLDDNDRSHGTTFYGYEILGGRDRLGDLWSQGIRNAFVAIGDNRKRVEVARLLRDHGFRLATVIHPTASLFRGSRIGEGAVVLVNAYVGADAVVGELAIVSIGVTVGHDARVGMGAQLAPGVVLAGAASVGDLAFLGMGAGVVQGVKIGRETVVGANAAVIADLPDYVTAVGIPARIIKQRMVEP